MNHEEVLQVVRVVLEIGEKHWLRHGTPLRPEDAELVATNAVSKILGDEIEKRVRETQ